MNNVFGLIIVEKSFMTNTVRNVKLIYKEKKYYNVLAVILKWDIVAFIGIGFCCVCNIM